jgi:hypothetical protein
MLRRIFPALLLAVMVVPGRAAPWDALKQKSVSRSHQFIIYAGDPNARAAIAMDAEDVKDKYLALLDADDQWKRPIVINVMPASAADPMAPISTVQVINTDEGFKVELNVVLGSDPRQVHFPEQLVRAILLEYAYRNQPLLVAPGVSYAEPPAWLVDGITSLTTDIDPDTQQDDAPLFRSLILSGKTPTLALFLSENPQTLDDPSRELYSACSMSLIRLLTGLPNGRALMQGFIRHWPGPNADPEAELLKAFPALDSGSQSLEKWWTLGLASLSAADRYQGLSLAETSDQLDGLLKFDVIIDKTGKTKNFSLGEYPEYAKAPGTAAALNTLNVRLLGLEAQCNPIMREVVAAYQTIVVELAHRDSHDLKARIAEIADYRTRLAAHMDQIADYLNWYEATQRTHASGSFDEYVRTADDLDKEANTPRTDPISRYLDSVEAQLAP